MTTEGTTSTTTVPEESQVSTTELTQTTEGPKELRDALGRSETENKELRQQLLGIRLGEIGLNSETGLGKAIAKEYDGELTIEALGTYAKDEYDHAGTVEATPPEVATGETLTQLEGVSTAVTPPPVTDPIAAAEEALAQPDSGRDEASAALTAKSNAFYQEHYAN